MKVVISRVANHVKLTIQSVNGFTEIFARDSRVAFWMLHGEWHVVEFDPHIHETTVQGCHNLSDMCVETH